MSRDVTLYLDDMVEACRRIGQYTQGLSRATLVSGTMAHDAVLRNLEVLGEAAKNVPADVRRLDVEIPWRRITGVRDVLAHAYFGIDATSCGASWLRKSRPCNRDWSPCAHGSDLRVTQLSSIDN